MAWNVIKYDSFHHDFKYGSMNVYMWALGVLCVLILAVYCKLLGPYTVACLVPGWVLLCLGIVLLDFLWELEWNYCTIWMRLKGSEDYQWQLD